MISALKSPAALDLLENGYENNDETLLACLLHYILPPANQQSRSLNATVTSALSFIIIQACLRECKSYGCGSALSRWYWGYLNGNILDMYCMLPAFLIGFFHSTEVRFLSFYL